jgi:hypothetical protein
VKGKPDRLMLPVPVCADHPMLQEMNTRFPTFVYRPDCAVYVPAPALDDPSITGVHVPSS